MGEPLNPAAVNSRFNRLFHDRPQAATDWFHGYCEEVDYLRSDAVARNLLWTTPTCWGTLEITVNLSKPEKDPKAIAAAARIAKPQCHPSAGDGEPTGPLCALCMANEGYPGRAESDPCGPWPDRSNLRIVRFGLGHETWGLQYSPYAYYEEHCIVLSARHRPMHIDRSTLGNLLQCVDLFPHYFFGSNADLPIVGGSILSHDHYQGGRHEFPMQKAPLAETFELQGHPHVEVGIVKWPLSVMRLHGSRADELLSAADHVLRTWRSYDDPDAGIVSASGGERHNTVTPIAYRSGDGYVLDLALRCNVTSTEHPLGVFHPHSELHRIKKENIGLIEVMGLAILPPRLLREFDGIRDDRLLQDEVGHLFAQVLEHCGVFKWDDTGRAAQRRFLDALQSGTMRRFLA